MIPLEEAQARLIALARPRAPETLPLIEAAGRWLSEDLIALRTQPARDLSAMDGYAVAGGSGPEWRLVGEAAAGAPFAKPLGAGETARIFTGAALPAGADAVVIQENVTANGKVICQTDGQPPVAGDHIRRAGSDFAGGDLLIAAGTRLSAAAIGLAAMGGYGALRVAPLVSVTIISTGNELMPPGTPSDDAHIPASNGPMLAALLKSWPVRLHDAGIVPDSLEATRAAIDAARDSDIIVTIGGASVGDHDLVRPALLAEGAELDFWKVAMRPGKPVMTGRLGNAIALGLPGNPVSAFVTATLFLRPLIAALSGATAPLPRTERATLGAPLSANGARTDHVRAAWTDGCVVPVGSGDSAALLALARSDALIVRTPGAKAAKIGEMVDIIRTT